MKKNTSGKSASALWASISSLWPSLCPTWQLPNAPKMIGQCVFLPAKMKNIMGKSYGGIIVPLCAPLYTIVHRSVPLYNFVQLHLENWNLLLHWERTTSTASISLIVFLEIINHILLLILVSVFSFNSHPLLFLSLVKVQTNSFQLPG